MDEDPGPHRYSALLERLSTQLRETGTRAALYHDESLLRLVREMIHALVRLRGDGQGNRGITWAAALSRVLQEASTAHRARTLAVVYRIDTCRDTSGDAPGDSMRSSESILRVLRAATPTDPEAVEGLLGLLHHQDSY